MELIDISRPLSPATAVWPGDQPVEWSWTARIDEGSSVNLGALQLSAHAGTHVDAPHHVQENGATTDRFELPVFIGTAQVVSVQDDWILPHHVEGVEAKRVLFKTQASTRSFTEWPDAITPIHPDTVSALAEGGTVLVGTDAPSVDPLDSTDLSAHHALIEENIVNLEGLVLADAEPGLYQLVALPIKVRGGDAAPVRAALLNRGAWKNAADVPDPLTSIESSN
jgi:arylformamidase